MSFKGSERVKAKAVSYADTTCYPERLAFMQAHSQQQMQQEQQQQQFRGVSRSPWSLTWDAHVTSPAAGLRAQLGLALLLPEQAQEKVNDLNEHKDSIGQKQDMSKRCWTEG